MSSQDLAGSEPAKTAESEPETGDVFDPGDAVSGGRLARTDRLALAARRPPHELLNGESRFNELKRETDANARTLSRVLDDLQETDFVDRRLEEDSPVATYYSLTPKGESLAPVFEEIDEWAHEWLAECSG